jgi:hypothetical protein
MYEPGSQPEIFHQRVGVCWRRSCDEDFRNYYRPMLRQVIPLFPDLNGMVIEIGMTNGTPHVLRKGRGNPRDVLRLQPRRFWLEGDRPDDRYTLTHELSHWIHNEEFTELFAMAHAPRGIIINPGYFPGAVRAVSCGMSDAIMDLAAMSLHIVGNRQLWFVSQVSELQIVAEIAGVIDIPKQPEFIRSYVRDEEQPTESFAK